MTNLTVKEKRLRLCTFLLIFLTSSFVVCNDIISSVMTIALWLITAGILLIDGHAIHRKCFWLFIVMAFLIGISTLANNENLRTFIVLLFSFAVVAMYASKYEYQEFSSVYEEIMYIICIISLIGYIAFLIITPLRNLIIVRNSAGSYFNNFWIYVAYRGHYNRNMGLFWEPGAFQTFINLALFFEIKKDKPEIKKIVIFAVSVLTTYSTTGYIGLLFIFLLLFIKKNKNTYLKVFLTVLLLAISIFLYFNSAFLFGSSLSTGEATVFGKILNFINGGQNSSVLSSANIRYNSIFEVIKAFLEKPVFGYGYQGLIERMYSYTQGMNTCTLINWFATYGLFMGVLMLCGYILFSIKNSKNLLEGIIVFAIMFVITMSENYAQNAFFILIAFYGFVSMPNDKILDTDGGDRELC